MQSDQCSGYSGSFGASQRRMSDRRRGGRGKSGKKHLNNV